jgi:hypothetical protein
MLPRLVSKVANQTDVLEMQSGGIVLNHVTRLVEPLADGHVGSTAALDSA